MAKLGKSQRDRDLTQVVAVAALNEEGRILFGKRGDNGKWCMPAGHLEPGEDPEEGAKRELQEESGLKLEAIRPLGSETVKGRSGGDVLVHAFLAAVSGEPTAENDPDEEFVEFSWEDPDDISSEILDNLHSKKDVVLRLLGIQEDEDLAKGAMSRLAPFNPHKDVNLEAQKPTAAWQDTHDHADREAIPRMEGAARMRALHGLHGKAQVRVNSEGEREFLLHRGHNPMEPHEGRKSWTTNYYEANSKARYNGGPGGAERLPGHPVEGHVTSRWIPESKIVSIPNQLGGIDTSRYHNLSPEGKWRGGKNEYNFEHEIIAEPMGPNHPDTVVHPYRRGILPDMRMQVLADQSSQAAFKASNGEHRRIVRIHPTTLEPLEKMALKDVPLGDTIRSNDQEDHFDYSHVLTPAHREAGFSLHVKFHRPRGEWKSVLTHKDHPLSPRGFVAAAPADENGIYLEESKLKDGYENQGFGKAMYEALLAHVHNYHGKQHVIGDVHSSMANRVHESLARKHGMEYKARRIGVPKGRYDDAYGQYGYVLKSDGMDPGFLDDLMGRDTPEAKAWRGKSLPWDDISRLLSHPDAAERSLALKMDGVTPAHLSFAAHNVRDEERFPAVEQYRRDLVGHPAHNEESIHSLVDNSNLHPKLMGALGDSDHQIDSFKAKFKPKHLEAWVQHPALRTHRIRQVVKYNPGLITKDNFMAIHNRLADLDMDDEGLPLNHINAPADLVDQEVKKAILDHSINKEILPSPRTIDLVRTSRMSPEMFDKIMNPEHPEVYGYDKPKETGDSEESVERRVIRRATANQVRYAAMHNKNLPSKYIDEEIKLHETQHPKRMETKHLAQALAGNPSVDSSHTNRVINGPMFPMDMKLQMMSHPAVKPEYLTQFIKPFEPEHEHDESMPFFPHEVAKAVTESPAFNDDHAVQLANLRGDTGFFAHAMLTELKHLPEKAIERLSQLGNAEIKKAIASKHDLNQDQASRLLADPSTSSVMARRLWPSNRLPGHPLRPEIDRGKLLDQALKSDNEGRTIVLKNAPLSDAQVHEIAHELPRNLVNLARRDDLSPAAISSLVSARIKHHAELTGEGENSVYGGASDRIGEIPGLTPEDQRRLFELRPIDGYDSLRNSLVKNPNLDERIAHSFVDDGQFASQLAENPGLHPDIARRLLAERGDDQEVIDGLAINHKTPEDVLESLIHHKNFNDQNLQALIDNPSTGMSTIRALVNHPASSALQQKSIRERIEEDDPDSVYKDKVAVRLGKSGSLGRIRKIRDLILEKSPKDKQLHPKQLPAGDWSAGRLPNGNISADKLQEHIDSHPAQQWNYSHTVWKGAQRHSDDNSKVFQLNLSNDHIRKMKEAGVWGTFKKMADASRQSSHPVEKSTIGWVRYTSVDKIKKLKEELSPESNPKKWADHAQKAIDAFRQKSTEISPDLKAELEYSQKLVDRVRGGEPAVLGRDHPLRAIMNRAEMSGWVKPPAKVIRPEKEGEAGTFVDEVQSDFGQSFVKQAQGQIRTQAANEARQQGMNEQDTVAHVNARVAEAGSAAEKEYPEEHFKKISQIVFGGRHPNEVVAEGFVQHLRDKGQHKSQVSWHTPESKAPISGLDTDKAFPGHFNVSYNDIPKKMGAEPSMYGKLQTETNKQMKGMNNEGKIEPENAAPTWNFKVRKFEDEIGPWLRSLKKSDVTKDPTRSFEVQLGYRPKRETAMAAGAMFSGKRDIESERNALVLKDGDYLAAAMQAHGISDPEALKQAMALVEAPKKAEDIETKLGDIQPATEDAKPFAEAIGRANRDGQIKKVHLDGVHSKGSYLATDPNGLTYLIKPGA